MFRVFLARHVTAVGLVVAGLAPASRAATFDAVATHPDAAAQPTATGRALLTLKPFDGRLYAGFGDYTANTGPIGVRAFDPISGDFGPRLLASGTEALYMFREIGGRLLAPHIDPIAGESSGGFAQGLPGAPDDAWRDRFEVTAVHLYDVFTTNGTDLWLIGSRGNDGAAWRSDDGTTWLDVPILAVPPIAPVTFTRLYFGGPFRGLVYVQAPEHATSKVFDGTWSDGPDLLPFGGYGWHAEVFADRLVYQSSQAGFGASRLMAFDGLEAIEAIPERVYDYTIADGALYALAAAWIPEPGTASGGRWVMDGVHRTTDLCTWSAVGEQAPQDARSLALMDGELYLGALEAILYRWSDAVTPAAPGPPGEVQLLKVAKSGRDVALSWDRVSSLGDCVGHEVLATALLPPDTYGLFAPLVQDLRATTWRHGGALDDRVSHAYLVRASSPAGVGPLGAYAR